MKTIVLSTLNISSKFVMSKSNINSRSCLNGVYNLEYIVSKVDKKEFKIINDNITNDKEDSKQANIQEIIEESDTFVKNNKDENPLFDENKHSKSDKILLKKLEQNESVVPASSLSRAARFSWLGLSMLSSATTSTIKSKIMNEENTSFKSHLINDKNSDRLSKTLCKMRGAALKFGQILSTFEDIVIPEPLRSALEKARQEANAMPKHQLLKTLSDDLGDNWESKFETFEIEPFAAASIGQVHFARIKNNNLILPVAVKIQFPGVAQSIESDLNNIKRVFKYLNIIPKGMYIDKLIDNLGTEIKEECDYFLEMDRQEHYKNLIANDKHLNKIFVVPEVYRDLSNNNIITSSFLHGVNVDELDNESQEVKDFVGEKLLELCLREIFIFKFMQTDPNPANFFLLKDPATQVNYAKNVKIGLLDFGAARDYKENFIKTYMNIVYNGTYFNKEKVIKFSQDLGFLTGFESEIMLNAHANSLFAIAEPFSQMVDNINQIFDFGNQKVTSRIYKELPIMLKHRLTSPPTEIYSLHRRLSGAYLMCIKLKSRVKSHLLFKNIIKEFEEMHSLDLKSIE